MENIQVKAVEQTAAVRAAGGKHLSKITPSLGRAQYWSYRRHPLPGVAGSRPLPRAGLTGAGGRWIWGWLPRRGEKWALQPGFWSPKSGLFLILIYFDCISNICPL